MIIRRAILCLFIAVVIYIPSSAKADVGIEDIYLLGPGGDGGTTTVPTGGSFNNSNVGCVAAQTWQAQSFQVNTGIFTQFTVNFASNVGSPTGSVTYEISEENLSVPGTALATGTFTPTANATSTVNTSSLALTLYSGVQYWLTFKSTQACPNNSYSIKSTQTDSYLFGQRAQTSDGGTTWSILTAQDLQISATTTASSDLFYLNDKIAQSFTVGGYVTATAIKLHLKKFNSPTGVITLNIESDVGNSPSGYLIADGATGTFNEADLTTDYALTTIDLDASINLQPGIKYWIVISTDREDSTDYVALGSTSECIVDQYLKVHNQGVWKGEDTTGIFEFSLSDTPEQPVSSNSSNIATLGALIILIVIGFGQVYLLLRVGQ